MRAGVARSLTPIVSWSGEEREVSDSTCPALARFHDPAYPLAAVWSGTFFELVPFRIDVACEAGSEGCLRIVSPDTIGGLARIRVSAEPQTIETAGSVELFERPGSANPVRAVVGPATKVEILEGAARVFWTRNRGSTYLEARDEWSRVRLDGRVGWMHAKFEAIGLPSAG